MSPTISIVIPCYNEEKRIVRFFDAYFERLVRTGLDFECVMVDDGSKDITHRMLMDRAANDSRIRPMTYAPNKGRGYAVRTGVLAAQGEYIFETDIDASYDVPEMVKFFDFLRAHPEYDMLIASREQNEAHAVVNQPILRMIAGKVFHFLFFFFFGREFTDVMAGCKMYRRSAAQVIFHHQYNNEFLGAAETVYAAKKLGFRIKELPVQWTDDREGSKVRPFREARRTLVGLLRMKIWDWKGRYTLKEN